MEIKKGNKYSCGRDVIMNDGTNRRAFTKGNTYVSENNHCLTDDNGNKEHYIVNTNEPPMFVVGEHFMWVGRVSDDEQTFLEKVDGVYEERSIKANDVPKQPTTTIKITMDELGLIQESLDSTYNNIIKAHQDLARVASASVLDGLLKSADEYKNIRFDIESPDNVGLDLATALKDLMAAEGGEPGDTLVGAAAWKQARMVLEFYGYE